MQYTTIDSIVYSELGHHGLPIHYYVQFLRYALDCVREFHFDVSRDTTTVRLTVDEFGEVDLPEDFIDWTRVGYQSGRYIYPLTQNATYNNLPNLDDDGTTQIPYPVYERPITSSDFYGSYYWQGNLSDYGESRGGYYGISDFMRGDVFQIVPDRGKMLVGALFQEGDDVYLEYLGHPNPVATSGVHPYAEGAIKAYIRLKYAMWKPNTRISEINLAERKWRKERRKYKARKANHSLEQWYSVFRKSYKLSIKS